jgi:hypothetical protein
MIAFLTGCSTSKITKTLETIEAPKVGLQQKAEISAHYIDHQPIEAQAKMVVEIDNLGNKTFTNDNFSFTVDAKGGTNFNKESIFYVGSFTKISALGGSPAVFGKPGGKTALKSNRDYVTELLHYKLIQEARKTGADALLGDINYEWKIEETSNLQTRFFGILPSKVLDKKVTFTVTGYSRTAKMVMDPYETAAEEESAEGNTDIKLNLDISTDGSVSGGSSSTTSGGKFKFLK